MTTFTRGTTTFLGFIALGSLLLAGPARASSMDEAKRTVKRAVAYVKYQGKANALAEFGKPRGMFDKGDLYVWAYDLQGVMLAHPKSPELVGKKLVDVPDADGKLFRKEIVEETKAKGWAWVDYKYLNPETKQLEYKTTYCQSVSDIIVCCGAYEEYEHGGD